MAILTKNNLLFLHVPKTGGNWVRKTLQLNGMVQKEFVVKTIRGVVAINKHSKYDMLKKEHPKLFKKLKGVFCFVRNPVSWYESWFRYSVEKYWKEWTNYYWHPCSKLNGLGSYKFNEFIKNVIEVQPGYLCKMYSVYTNNCSFIGSQEYLKEGLSKIFDTTDWTFPDRINVSKPIAIDWDAKLKEKIIKLEREAFWKYGY